MHRPPSSLTMLWQRAASRAEPEGAACRLQGSKLLQRPCAGCACHWGRGEALSSALTCPVCLPSPGCPSTAWWLGTSLWQGQGQSVPGSSRRLCLELKPHICPEVRLGRCGMVAGWSSLGLQRLAITLGSTQRCTAAAPDCSFLSKRERKSISAKSRLGLCLKPLSKEPCLNVIAPLLLQGENTLYCSFFLGKLR